MKYLPLLLLCSLLLACTSSPDEVAENAASAATAVVAEAETEVKTATPQPATSTATPTTEPTPTTMPTKTPMPTATATATATPEPTEIPKLPPMTANGLTLISVSTEGVQADKDSREPAISANGRFVAFVSDARNLVAGDVNRKADVFVRDLETLETTIVSIASDGTQADRESFNPSISADGRYVAFESLATTLVNEPQNPGRDVFVHDRETGETILASPPLLSITQSAGDEAVCPSISADGRYVTFKSSYSNLLAERTTPKGISQAYVRDLHENTTEIVSIANDGRIATELDSDLNECPVISGDGRFVMFILHTNLTDDLNAEDHVQRIYFRDRQEGVTFHLTNSQDGTNLETDPYTLSLSHDGRLVAIHSRIGVAYNGERGGFLVYDREADTLQRLTSKTIDGRPMNGGLISGDGQFVVLWAGEQGSAAQVEDKSWRLYLANVATGELEELPFGSDPDKRSAVYDRRVLNVGISGDGSRIVFASDRSDLVPEQAEGRPDIFVYTRPAP